MGFYPMAVSLRECNTQIHILYTHTHITQNNTTKNKQTNKKQISSQMYANCGGHITDHEYRVEKEKK
jgi:hypothetical protein